MQSNPVISSGINHRIHSTDTSATMGTTNVQEKPRITSNEEILEALQPIPSFVTRDDIKPWIHEKLDGRGINLVIERSDASKVVFKCKNIHRRSINSIPSTTQKSTVKSFAMSNSDKPASRKQRRIRALAEESCPFRLRVSYSVKHKIWGVNIIKSDHNPQICCNFGDPALQNFSPSSTTPGSVGSGKRSWSSASYTPSSTVSPAFSSPASSIFTPASENFDLDGFNDSKFMMKKQRLSIPGGLSYVESPLYREVDPLEELSLPEDLSDINHLYDPMDKAINSSRPFGDSQLDFSHSFNDQADSDDALSKLSLNLITNDERESHFDSHMFHELTPILESSVASPVNSQMDSFMQQQQHPKHAQPQYSSFQQPHHQQHIDFDANSFINTAALDPSYIIPDPMSFRGNSSNASKAITGQPGYNRVNTNPSNLFNVNARLVNESSDQEEDPLMYLLNTGSTANPNQNYTLEELENMDKAMGFDDNDKFLMSMFQPM